MPLGRWGIVRNLHNLSSLSMEMKTGKYLGGAMWKIDSLMWVNLIYGKFIFLVNVANIVHLKYGERQNKVRQILQ